MMVYLLHRNPSVTGYCPQMQRMTDKDYVKKVNLSSFDDDHYVCVNMGHYEEGNIELRLVGGQANFPCFRNTMECIFHIIEACKNVSWSDLDNVVRIFSGCNQYVFDRLKSFVRDNGQISAEAVEAIYHTVKVENLL